MLRSTSGLAVLLATATPAFAQRADENVVQAADDAFGTSVGNDKIGLYSADDVRGFSPAQAGNIRLEGLALTEHGGFSGRVVTGSTIRVGLTAQGYPFPAPTGIADFSLRKPGNETVLSPVVYLGPFRSAGIEVDAQFPIVRDRLSFAGGLSYRDQENFRGDDNKSTHVGGVLRWRPSGGVEINGFYGLVDIFHDRNIGSIFTGGAYLPSKVERRYFGLDWTISKARRQFYGTLGTAKLTENWDIRAGIFRWENYGDQIISELYRNVQPDGSAQRTVVASEDVNSKSTSGEARSAYSITEGRRRHTLLVAVRGRDTRRTYGGSDVIDLGAANIGYKIDVAEPEFEFGPLSNDHIQQVTGALGYELRWPGVAELSLGLQKTDYEKRSDIPGLPLLVTKDQPWLYNGTAAAYLTDKLVVYAGYARGLEDSGSAPADAVNRNSAPPALRTSQRDAGIRYAILPRLTLVAGLFDVRKPYFNVDPDRFYRQLGMVRHRGIELSLAGQPLEGFTLVGGAVLLDADVSGEAVDLGIIGPKPVGTASRTLRLNLDYRFPRFEPLSVDIGITSRGPQIASAAIYEELGGRQLTTGSKTTVDLGMRYRFKLGQVPATLRAQVTNLFNVYAWDVSANSSFRFSDTRRVFATLAADF